MPKHPRFRHLPGPQSRALPAGVRSRMKEPAKVVRDWPPKGFAKAVQPSGGENFWTIARDHGRQNPWDLIIYNFQTEDTHEVNWYLHWACGCTRSYDGKNLDFEAARLSDDSYGTIYIPPKSWLPASTYQKGSAAGAFMDAVYEAAISVLTRTAKRIPRCVVGSTSIGTDGLEKVAELLNTRKVTLLVNPELGVNARYVPIFQEIRIGRMPTRRSVGMHETLVNEATHAWTHWRELEVRLSKTELCSTLAGTVAAAAMSPNWVLRKMRNLDAEQDGWYFPAWVWSQHFPGRSVLGPGDFTKKFHHPVHDEPRNAWKMFVRDHLKRKAYRKHFNSGETHGYDWIGDK